MRRCVKRDEARKGEGERTRSRVLAVRILHNYGKLVQR